MWTHLIFEAYCGFNWDDNSEFLYELDPDMEMGDDWLDKLKEVPNPRYDSDKKPREKPKFCKEIGDVCYNCQENNCPYLCMYPVDENEYNIMVDAWKNISTTKVIKNDN